VAYRLQYSEVALRHLDSLPARQQRSVAGAVEEHLLHQPTLATRRRKRLRPNRRGNSASATYEYYYAVEEGEDPVVSVVAIGRKQRNTVYIGGEAVQL
jgi:hypothetical protein